MLVYYAGWGYWEENNEELRQVGQISPFIKAHSLFDLSIDAERDINKQKKTITDNLLISKHSTIKEPNPTHGGDVYFVLCDEPFHTPPDTHLQANKITKEYTIDDIQPDIVDLGADTSKDLTEAERNTLLKLILGMAIDTYGYVPGATKNPATGNNRGSIKASLEKVGLSADQKTISKYLQEAIERYPDAKPPKS